MRGGYKIIDLQNKNITTTEVTIDNLYESIESNYRKPLLLSNLVIDGKELANIYVYAIVDGTDYKLYFGDTTNHLLVSDTNTIKLEANA